MSAINNANANNALAADWHHPPLQPGRTRVIHTWGPNLRALFSAQTPSRHQTQQNDFWCAKERRWWPSTRFPLFRRSPTHDEFYTVCAVCRYGGIKKAKRDGLLLP